MHRKHTHHYTLQIHTQADDSDDEPPDESGSAADYLTPFLPPGLTGGGMSREHCLGVRERCLRALKDRLVERANIIQVCVLDGLSVSGHLLVWTGCAVLDCACLQRGALTNR